VVARERLSPALALVAASLVVPAAVVHYFGDPTHDSHGIYVFHFWVVLATMLAATAASFALSRIGARQRDARAVIVGTAFSAMAALLLIHGLATPDVILAEQAHDSTSLMAFAGGATLPVGGAVLSLAAVPALLRPTAVPNLLRLQAALTVGIVVVGLLGMLEANLLPAEPRANGPAAVSLLVVTLALFALLARRALRTFILTRRGGDLLVVCGISLLGVSLTASLTQHPWSLGWWMAHALELIGIGMVGIPVAMDLRRGGQSRPLSGDLRSTELVRREEDYLGSHVRALMLALADKDAYTAEHTRRVAGLAARVGEQLGLAPHRQRTLAIGGLLHDIGKLQVPDSVLKKPGPLDDAEYACIKRHPEWGDELARELGMPGPVRALIRSHHERLDGAGYPDGLRGDDLPLDVRILAACDVYDALISKRVYRDPWSREDALTRLHSEAGTAFDQRCVEALEAVLARPSSSYEIPAELRAAGRRPAAGYS
jgi:putative nucleotidyltransferase with HDIG domain